MIMGYHATQPFPQAFLRIEFRRIARLRPQHQMPLSLLHHLVDHLPPVLFRTVVNKNFWT
jgi:hypothetical protein